VKTAQLRRLALRLWDRLAAIAETLPERPRESSRDLANESLTAMAGELADVLSQLQNASPKRAKRGFAPDLLPRFERLVGLTNWQRIFALARLVQSLAFYHWLAPEWTEANLFTALDNDNPEARELLETLVLYGRFDRIKVLARLKDRIFAAVVSDDIADEARNRLATLVTWMTIRRLTGHDDVKITQTETRQLLTRAPSSALRSVAWSLWRHLYDVKPESRKAHWTRYIKPFLERVWPNDISTRDAKISEHLARIPSVAGAGFPDAVRVIINLIVPFKIISASTEFDLDENLNLIKRYPSEALGLAIAAIDLTAPPPYDLQEFLDRITAHTPQLKGDVRFQKLNALLHGR
jgi:hypothetical protein